jgi:hypothetical protein
MGGGSKEQKQTTTYELSPEQRELMNLALPGVKEFAGKVPERYPGSTISGFDQSQTAGQEAALRAAGRQDAIANIGQDVSSRWMSPDALDVTNNPAVRGAIDTATRPIYEQLQRSALPAVRDSAERSNNFGASRQGIAEGIAMEGASKATADVSSKIGYDAYAKNVDAQLKALGLMPQTQAAQTTGAYTTSNVGDVRQDMSQKLLSEDVSNFNYDQLAPFLQSKEIMALLSGLPGGSTTTTATAPQQNKLLGALGGAASGASMGSMFGPMGMGIGGGLGALLSFLS